ncbi:general secretion pathway protein GspB [Thalassolituus sp. LLYu03]|uniref:general secretion pathway protein GspB n=1 Tax=Thalassolituus sp. LLYu03 TaxID=3421656 RepID=UPI003D2B9F11
MSYILDALKKSEQERAAANTSVAQALAQPQIVQAALPVWLMPVLVMLVLLLVAALILNALPQHEPVAPADVAPVAEVAVMSPQPEISAQQPVPAEAPDLTSAPVPVPIPEPASATAADSRAEPPAAAERLSPAGDARTMPPLEALRRIPQLMINSHIYSPVADKRSVVMNNREWAEGSWLAEGVLLKEITPDGILLDVEGWPVHVGRSKGWQAIP